MLFWTLLGVVNLVTLLLYGYDKVAASRGWWRVAERTLHLFALLGGSPAAFAAQKMFRHKSVKPSFRRVFWGIVVLQVAAIGAYWIWA